MSGTELHTRLSLLDELAQIVAAMKNLAYAELQRLGRRQPCQVLAEQTLAQALADLLQHQQLPAGRAQICLVVGADRGFCGGFNDALAEAAAELTQGDQITHWLIAGERLNQRLDGQYPDAINLPGCSGSENPLETIEQWMDALLPLLDRPLAPPQLWVLHHGEYQVVHRQLLPPKGLSALARQPAPQRYLELPQLLPPLLAEYLRLQLMGVLLLSLQQENQARLAQMKRAQDHLNDTRQQLRQRYFRQRQADITGELETLMSSLEQAHPKGPKTAPKETN